MNNQERIEFIDYRRSIRAALPDKRWPMRPTDEPARLESAAREGVFVFQDPAGPAPGSSLLERLRQRKLCRWTLGYLAVAWMLLQLTDVLSEVWRWSLLAQQIVSVVLALGLPPAIVVAWYHGEKGRQRVCKLEVALLTALIVGAGLTIRALCVGLLGMT